MLDFNSFGACLLIASIGLVRFVQGFKPHPQLPTPTNNKKIVRTALIDIKLPYKTNVALQHLKNDEILSKVLSDKHKKFYVCIQSEGDAPNALIIDYMSSLYSKIWNEAILKNCLEMECCVVSDNLKSAGLITRDQICLLPDLHTVYFNTQNQVSLTRLLRSQVVTKNSNFVTTEFVDTNTFTQTLEDTYLNYPNIHYFDSFCHPSDQPMKEVPVFPRVALGGTFDRLHNGHRKLLTLAAASCSEKLTVGIMSADLLRKKASFSLISPFAVREDGVRQFVGGIKPQLETHLVELHDPFGPTITDPHIDAIIVSSETISGAFKINSLRAERNMKPLAILVTYRGDTAVLSSTFIREKQSAGK